MTTIAISPFTMPAALAAADNLFGYKLNWVGDPNSEEQMSWLQTFRPRAFSAGLMPEIKSHATEVLAQHVAWLKEQGWDSLINEAMPSYDLLLASTLNLTAKWYQPGIAYMENMVDRVLMKKSGRVSDHSRNPVVTVGTQTPGISFCFKQVDIAPTTRTELLDYAMRVAFEPTYEKVDFDFPMVDLLVRDDASYMIGLSTQTGDRDHVVTAAVEQLRLEMNEIGGRASAAAEVAVSRGIDLNSRLVKITGPFVVAVKYETSALPISFAAYVDRDAWKTPARCAGSSIPSMEHADARRHDVGPDGGARGRRRARTHGRI